VRVWLFAAFLTVAGCTWLTNFDELSEPTAGSGAARDAALETDGPPSPEAGDADPSDAASDAVVVFADDFDDGVALPRSWDLASGGPVIEQADDAPTPAAVLAATSLGAEPAAPFVEKTLDATTAESVVFRFHMKELAFTGDSYMIVAEVTSGSKRKIWLMRSFSEWQLYTIFDQVEKSAFGVAVAGAWLPVEIRVSRTGRVDMTVAGASGFVEHGDLGSLESMTLRIGVVPPTTPGDRRVLFDSVRIAR
jgi:hypothetical protein